MKSKKIRMALYAVLVGFAVVALLSSCDKSENLLGDTIDAPLVVEDFSSLEEEVVFEKIGKDEAYSNSSLLRSAGTDGPYYARGMYAGYLISKEYKQVGPIKILIKGTQK